MIKAGSVRTQIEYQASVKVLQMDSLDYMFHFRQNPNWTSQTLVDAQSPVMLFTGSVLCQATALCLGRVDHIMSVPPYSIT